MRLALAALCLLLLSLGTAQAVDVQLHGAFEQGGVIIGKVPAGSKVSLDGQALRVSPDGDIVFGFGRDHGDSATLVVEKQDGSREERQLSIAARDYDIQRIEGVEQKYVAPPAEVLARIRRENAEIARVRAIDHPEPLFRNGFIWPAHGPISGVYGSQRVFNGVPKRPHYGVDVAAPVGTPILAPADGVVTLAEPDLYYSGGTVILDHGHGLTSAFLHMDSVTVKVGDRLKQGDQLGTLGAKGRVTGPHLDWRMNWFKQRVDPQTLVGAMPGY